jgi:septal ring factor EnvC (AmiA/AmiB activator)
VTCCGILAIAAAGKGFLYLDNGISTVESAVGSAVKDLNTLKAQVTAADTKEQLATVTAEAKDLKTTNTQLRAEVEQIRDTLEALKVKKNNIVSAQRKR